MNITDDLNEAVGLWFFTYHSKEERIIERFGKEYGETLLHDVKIIKDKFWEYEPDWTKYTLEEAASIAITRIHEEYPGLNRYALARMRNSFFFSYK